MKLLVTGASGFVGEAVCRRLQADDLSFIRAVRSNSKERDSVVVGDIDSSTDWSRAVSGCDGVVHLAARVHVMRDRSTDPLTAFRAVNVGGTLNLARQASEAGVKRFVFVSSVKVNGETTARGCPFTVECAPSPQDPYAISKWEAEQGLRELEARTDMELVIVRPPLVYGPGVEANFETMMHWLSKGIPLPFGAIDNRRSLVALENLVDLLVTCVSHPEAAGQTFMVSDGEDVSTTELLRRLGVALGRPAWLLPVPTSWLRKAAAMMGKGDVAQRLFGSLQVDISKTRELLGWTPPIGLDEGLYRTARAFISRGAKGA